MRSSRLALPLLALVGCADTGAHLTLSAPDGPHSAETFRVVLATPEQVPSINGQRVKPGDSAVQTVSYYLQRTVAGAAERTIDSVDGFTVRIAPDGDVTETQFIPFILMYDANGAIVGIGSFRTGDAKLPTPILVVQDEIDKYTLEIEAVKDIGDLDEPGPGQVQQISCTNRETQETFVSGVVWRPFDGGEYRLLFPIDGSMDATGRALDLDCDDHEVKPDNSRPDCDDTRSIFHRDAPDTCDGLDTNCDGLSTVATTCNANSQCVNTSMPAPTGIALCDDTTGTPQDCTPNANCGCLLGTACHKCYLSWDHGTQQGYVQPCQPSIGGLKMYDLCNNTARCTVEVLGARNGWKVQIASSSGGSFGNQALDVGDILALKISRSEGPSYELMGGANTQVSDLDLSVITPTGTQYLGVQLRLDDASVTGDACPSAPTFMCYP